MPILPNARTHRFTFDPASPVLVLAPHLEHPLRDGADILIDRRWAAFSRHVPSVHIIGKDTLSRYEDGQLADRTSFANEYRTKPHAAFRTLLRRSHYLLEKFLTPGFVEVAVEHLRDPAYGTVVFSYLCSATLAEEIPPRQNRLLLVETHNDDFEWFSNIRSGTWNPLARQAAALSERWTARFLEQHASDFLYLHVTEADQAGYAERVSGHASLVAPVGVEVNYDEQLHRLSPDQVRLLFVGALNTQINRDALAYFGERFEPVLRSHVGDRLDVVVAGSRPSRRVRRLCREKGWTLHPDVPEDGLRRLYGSAWFAILPFAYTTGAKLKLLKALSQGVPFLATTKIHAQLDQCPYPCLLSDDPADWAARIDAVRSEGIDRAERTALVAQAEQHSWETIARHLYERLCALPSVA